MKTSKCFKRIKEAALQKNPEVMWFICIVAKDVLTKEDAIGVRNLIRELLGGFVSLSNWLSCNSDEYEKEQSSMSDEDWCDKLHNTRIAWLDHLIDHYESIGD